MISTRFPYFRPGYPTSENSGQIAFYQPFFDRFLLIVPQEVLVVLKISMLANLRYPVLPMYVSGAPGFHHNLLDNGCCENWTVALENKHREKIYDNDRATLIIQQSQRIHPSRSLPDQYSIFSIDAEKRWFQLLWFWQEFLEFIFMYKNPYQPVIDFVDANLMPTSIQPEYRRQMSDFCKQVNLILSVEHDALAADQAIYRYIADQCTWLNDVLEYFIDSQIKDYHP